MKRTSQAGFTAYCELAPGETFRINAKQVSGNAKLTYISSDASVAKVSGKGIVRKQIAKENSAKDAMTTVKESHLREDYRLAKKKVEKLDIGALRTNYLKQLKELKEKLKS